MRLTIVYFARLREALGMAREIVDAPAGVSSVGQLRSWVAGRGEPWKSAFAEVQPIRVAQDHELAADDTALRPGAEVAFFPPVTGG